MSNFFGLKEEIRKDEFIKRWGDSERERDEAGVSDSFAHQHLEQHKKYIELKYCIVTLTEDGLDNLILPHHIHGNSKVSSGGEPFRRVISRYSKRIQAGESDDCLQRLYWIKHNIIKLNEIEGLLEAKFMFISEDRELAMPKGYYEDRGENKLYAGNYHQFVAYGLWVEENYYRPIKICYCERIYS